jgi:hypothetical protein
MVIRVPASPDSHTVFVGSRRLGGGSLPTVSLLARRALADDHDGPVLVFDDRTGKVVDVDTRGTEADVLARLSPESPSAIATPDPATPLETGSEPRGRGRPKLGVTAREVTLLPRHWDWLSRQPGGASVALRRLVEDAKRLADQSGRDDQRQAQERAYRFMTTMAGDLRNYEEATRALFAKDAARLRELIEGWPADIRAHSLRLAALAD